MGRQDAKGVWNWVVAAGVGALAGLMLWWGLRQGIPQDPNVAGQLRPPVAASGETTRPDNVAIRYARAFQRGAWDEVIGLTWWMQERLAWVQLQSADAADLAEARRGLRARLRKRSVPGNQLRPEGIEDQYIFTPEAEFEEVGVDAGRTDLAKPVRERMWIRVTYAERNRAPRDEAGRPIRSITVGVNVSTDGFVLKAGVVGNLDLLKRSVRYDWPE